MEDQKARIIILHKLQNFGGLSPAAHGVITYGGSMLEEKR